MSKPHSTEVLVRDRVATLKEGESYDAWGLSRSIDRPDSAFEVERVLKKLVKEGVAYKVDANYYGRIVGVRDEVLAVEQDERD